MLLCFWRFAVPLGAHRFYLRARRTVWPMLGLFAMSILMIFVLPALSLLGIAALALWLMADHFLIRGLTQQANQHSTHLALTCAAWGCAGHTKAAIAAGDDHI
jgi:hypothetical protein